MLGKSGKNRENYQNNRGKSELSHPPLCSIVALVWEDVSKNIIKIVSKVTLKSVAG